MTAGQIKTLSIRFATIFLVLILLALAVFSQRLLKRLPNEIVYFIASQSNHFSLKAAARKSDATTPEARLKEIVNALISGPTAKEKQKGLSSSLPKKTRLLNLQINGNEVVVDFSKDFLEPKGVSATVGMLNQLYYSLSQDKSIDSVRILVEGKALNYIGGEGIVVEQPWRKRNDKLPTW